MQSALNTSVVPHFTITAGWMRGFSPEVTATLTGRAVASVEIEYQLLNKRRETALSMPDELLT